jgi:hypothetical protein
LLRHDLIKIGAEERGYTAICSHQKFLNQEPKWQQTKPHSSHADVVAHQAAGRQRERAAGLTATS